MSDTHTDTDTDTEIGHRDDARSAGSRSAYRLPAVDLYRDIHKGIRAELFAITTTASALDPADRDDRAALRAHITSVADVLESHAAHEDAVIDPVLARHAPDLAESIQNDHQRIERSFADVVHLANDLLHAPPTEQRRLAHLLHLDLATFTGEYLVHQDVEERIVMPTLEHSVGVEAVAQMHAAIVGSIPPDELMRSLAFMLPAMNVLDRTEVLSGIRAAAPAPAFEAAMSLARSVLPASGFEPLVARLAPVPV